MTAAAPAASSARNIERLLRPRSVGGGRFADARRFGRFSRRQSRTDGIRGRNDPEWGPIVLAGFGGVQAEILHDVRLMPADLTLEGYARELQLLKSAPLLRGFRGSPPLEIAAVAEIIARIAALLRGEPDIREIDLNPVIVYAKTEGAIALDALLVVA